MALALLAPTTLINGTTMAVAVMTVAKRVITLLLRIGMLYLLLVSIRATTRDRWHLPALGCQRPISLQLRCSVAEGGLWAGG